MDINTFQGMVIGFVTVAIVIGIIGTVLLGVQGTQTTNSIPYNATSSGLTGIETFGDWLPTIAVIVAAAVVIGIILVYFRG